MDSLLESHGIGIGRHCATEGSRAREGLFPTGPSCEPFGALWGLDHLMDGNGASVVVLSRDCKALSSVRRCHDTSIT